MPNLKSQWDKAQEDVALAKENYDMSHLITRRYATVLSQMEQRENTARLKYLRDIVDPVDHDKINLYKCGINPTNFK